MPTDLDPAAVTPGTPGVERIEVSPDTTGVESGALPAQRTAADAVSSDDVTAAHAGNGSHPSEADLAARVRAVEDLPLADRADGFSTLHDELRTRLETGGAGA